MKDFSVVLAFASGCLLAATLHLVTDAHAAGTRSMAASAPRAALESRLAALERRAHVLEFGHMSSSVVAPFQVVNAAGSPIFSVDAHGVNVYSGGKPAAGMSGDRAGGRLVASSQSGRSVWLDGSAGPIFSVSETSSDASGRLTGDTRIDLGKGGEGSYRLKFTAKGGLTVAGFGEDRKSHTGLILVADKQGKAKVRLSVNDEGNGLVDVLGSSSFPIVQLTQGVHGGGLFLICAVSGCPPRMVEMGDAGGFGMVSTGPHWFNPGPTMLSLPGSVLFGRP